MYLVAGIVPFLQTAIMGNKYSLSLSDNDIHNAWCIVL